jgi:hypothetical protein
MTSETVLATTQRANGEMPMEFVRIGDALGRPLRAVFANFWLDNRRFYFVLRRLGFFFHFFKVGWAPYAVPSYCSMRDRPSRALTPSDVSFIWWAPISSLIHYILA